MALVLSKVCCNLLPPARFLLIWSTKVYEIHPHPYIQKHHHRLSLISLPPAGSNTWWQSHPHKLNKKKKKNWSMQFQRLHQLKAQYEFIIMTVDTKSRFLGEIAWSLEGRLTRVVWYHWIVEVNPINQSAPNEIAIVFVCPCTLRRPRAWVAWNSWSSWKWGHIRR